MFRRIVIAVTSCVMVAAGLLLSGPSTVAAREASEDSGPFWQAVSAGLGDTTTRTTPTRVGTATDRADVTARNGYTTSANGRGPAVTTGSPSVASSTGRARPNIVLILTDDMRADELRHLPRIRRLLVRRGVRYTQAISPHPLCCPARATLLTGQYAQNNGVQHNGGPWGGYGSLRRPRNTVARWLHDAGYRTGYHGKFLNFFWRSGGERPPGWDVWQPQVSATYAYGMRPTRFGGGIVFRDTYIATAVQQLTQRSIRGALRTNKPFFEWVNHIAPHRFIIPGEIPATHPVYERRYAGAYRNFLPRVIREGYFDGSDASRRYLITHARARLRALRSVDDAVARTVRQLRRADELDQTYFVFTSDNGYQLGEQGILGKNRLFEESLRVPLVIRGPGIEPGTRNDTPVSLVDLVPTLLRWARAQPGRPLDGLPLGDVGPQTRDTMLIQTGDALADSSPGWLWRGVRTSDYVYASPVGDPDGGFLYDLDADPDQRANLIHQPVYSKVRRELERRTTVLSDCVGAACNQVFGPLPG